MRETSWLAGAWVRASDGNPEPAWPLIGMVAKHRQPMPPGIGFVDPGYCVIMLHEFDPEWLARVSSGQTFSYRFEMPGLTLEWAAFAGGEIGADFGEAHHFRVDFAGAPRVIAADERWAGFLAAYPLRVAEAMPT